ncbi:respirasome Complex Assembly Factor 1-like [Zingiber officinale]|uniref:respirasome Complex Assembly Factor 1-like n=1 Tax=Zingiber officinale TaxID=94328 RepID=UPI001C4C728C|nr:respirasome Complex Assembly Factor 1-like [Zingiber officinale]
MKKTKSNKASSQELQNGHTPSSKFLKLLDPQASWDKDNLGDTLHWIRQGLGLSCGLLCGAVPLIGAFWIVAFMVLSTSIIYGYYTYVLKLDEEDFGGHGALLQEGLFASFSLFLLSWIVIYSLLHF